LADKLYGVREQLFQSALAMLNGCGCETGCPSCVGPAEIVGEHGKSVTRRFLEAGVGM
jgi:DEAD/DEAH box helicase domain-containing protein